MDDCRLKLLIRADAGPKIGTGHVMRMIALGQAWKRLHGETTFVCGDLPRGLMNRISREGFAIYKIADATGDKNDARQTVEIATVCQPDWIVLDGYRFDDSYQRVFANTPAKLMVMDDFRHASHQHADLVLNQNLQVNKGAFPHPSNRPECLGGPQYALLRREFSDVDSSRRRIFSTANRILVNFGGADPDNWTLRTLQALSDLSRPRLVVDCVLGACFQHMEQVLALKKTANMHMRIHRNIDRIDTLMEFVDLAVSAGGSTCYELARYGVPSIVIPIAENQHPVATAMAESGAMVTLPGWHDQIQSIPSNIDSTLRRMLRRVMNNREHREQMSACGHQIVDGQGAHRIARRLSASCYTLRPATLDDGQLIWNWRNHPEVRALSFNEQRIAFGSHQSWMRQKLADPNCVYWIAVDKFGLPVGQIRCDVDAAGSATVNVIVEQGRRGTGIGTVLIKLATDSMFEQGLARQMVAQIRPVNVASERAFRKVGFQPIAPTTLNGKLASQFVMKQEWLSAPLLTSRHPLKKSA